MLLISAHLKAILFYVFSYMANSSVAVKSNNYLIIVEWKSIRAKGNNTVTTRIF
jgi:hypothetical protein